MVQVVEVVKVVAGHGDGGDVEGGSSKSASGAIVDTSLDVLTLLRW